MRTLAGSSRLSLHTRAAVLGAAALCFTAVPAAHAQTTQYTDTAAFLAQLNPNAYTETFTSPTRGNAPSFSYSQNGFSYTITSTSTPGSGYDSAVYLGNGITGANFPFSNVVFTFTSGNVTAVGGNFFQTSINDEFLSSPVTLTLSNGATTTYTPTSTGTFQGFTTTLAISSITFAAPTQDGIYPAIDNFTVGTNKNLAAVPEPGVWVTAASLLGTTGIGLVRGRRRKTASQSA